MALHTRTKRDRHASGRGVARTHTPIVGACGGDAVGRAQREHALLGGNGGEGDRPCAYAWHLMNHPSSDGCDKSPNIYTCTCTCTCVCVTADRVIRHVCVHTHARNGSRYEVRAVHGCGAHARCGLLSWRPGRPRIVHVAGWSSRGEQRSAEHVHVRWCDVTGMSGQRWRSKRWRRVERGRSGCAIGLAIILIWKSISKMETMARVEVTHGRVESRTRQ